jgi:hypothetical protein
VSHRYPLERWTEAFDALRRSAGVKQLLVPGTAAA